MGEEEEEWGVEESSGRGAFREDDEARRGGLARHDNGTHASLG